MTWKSFWRSVGHDIEHAATGISKFATHAVDEAASVVKVLGNDAVKISHEAGGAVSSVGSSLSMSLAIAAAGLVGFLMLKK